MKKRYFWAADFHSPATLHRFPTRSARETWIEESKLRAEVGANHPAFWAVRRVNRQLSQGEQVSFPVVLE